MSRFAGPRADHLQLLARNDVRIERHRPGIAVVAENKIASAIAAHLYAFYDRRWNADTFEHCVRAIAAGQFPHGFNARFRLVHLADIDYVVSAKPPRHLEAISGSAHDDRLTGN